MGACEAESWRPLSPASDAALLGNEDRGRVGGSADSQGEGNLYPNLLERRLPIRPYLFLPLAGTRWSSRSDRGKCVPNCGTPQLQPSLAPQSFEQECLLILLAVNDH